MLDIAANQRSYIETCSVTAEEDCTLPVELIRRLAGEGLFAVTLASGMVVWSYQH